MMLVIFNFNHNSMKILIVTNMWPVKDYSYFGIFVKEQIEALCSSNPNVSCEVYFINGRKNKLAYLKSIIVVNYRLMVGKYDLVHVHFTLSGIFLLFNPLLKTPVITTLHGSDIHFNNIFLDFITQFVLDRSKKIIYLNEIMRSQLIRFEDKLVRLPCGIDTTLFCDRGVKKEMLFRIGFPSSKLRPEKNYFLFSNIISEFKEKHDVDIDIIEIHNKSRIEVAEVLNSIDLLLMTSLSEGSPQIIKEAMACNTPIICTNVGDVEIMLSGLLNCKVINSFNSIDFIGPMEDILIKNRFFKTNGRQKIFELGLNKESVSQQLFNVYNSFKS